MKTLKLTGAWKPKKNKALAGRTAKLLSALKARGVIVHFTHVRAHRQHHMNERADRLADLGRRPDHDSLPRGTPTPAR